MIQLDYSTQLIEQDDIDGIIDVLKGPCLAQGPKVEAFETALCNYTGAKHAICCNSATSALFSAYSVAGISDGDEIITTPISFVATSNMFVTLGATPVWCDVKDDGNIDEDKIEELITSKTKAIVPIDYAGKPVDIEKIKAIAKKHNLIVIQDSAHSLGSSINGKKIGSFSDMTIFSFHAIKPITTSEGGAVLTDSDDYASKLRLIRSHGITKKEFYDADMQSMGYNFRMTEVAASLGLSQMKKLDDFIYKRKTIADYYDEVFKDNKLFKSLHIDKHHCSSRHLYPIFLDKIFYNSKALILQKLQDAKLGIQIHYKPIYQNSFYREKFGDISLPGAEKLFNSEISIPCHQKMSLDDAKYVADVLINVTEKLYEGENVK